MFNYSLKTKIILLVILLAIIVGVVIIVRYNFSRSRDLYFVSQINSLADSLERYYDKFNAYPITDNISVEQIQIITDKGINKSGEIVYFVSPTRWMDSAVLLSNGNNYRIDFNLKNSWPLWSLLKSGGICRISTGMQMQCLEQ